jgi:opacity protein-like surface antigen
MEPLPTLAAARIGPIHTKGTRMKLIAIAAASALLVLGTAHAQQARSALSGGYAEIGYTQLKLSGEGAADAKPGAIRGIVGYDVHPNFALEGMLAFGVRDDNASETFSTGFGPVTATGEIKLKHAFGLYVKPKFDLTDAVQVYGRVGYTRARFEASATATVPGVGTVSASDADSEGGASFGLGANFKFTPNAYVGLDYMRYFKRDGVNVNGLTIGLGYRF